MTDTNWATADLIDAHPDTVHAVLGTYTDYGGAPTFRGPIATLRVAEDFRPVLAELQQPGGGRVLVVDAGGSRDRAVLGERLLNIASANGWAGVVIHGAVRDTALTRRVPIGLRALGTVPQRGESGVEAVRGEPVTFAQVTFVPREMLWADEDGIVVGSAPGQ